MIALYMSNGKGVIQEFERTPEFEHIDITNTDLSGFSNPILVDGVVVEGEPIPAEVPTEITPLQFWRSVYRLTGLTEESVVNQIEQTIPEPPKVEILIMLKKAIQFERNNPELVQMASNFDINSKTLDQIFIDA